MTLTLGGSVALPESIFAQLAGPLAPAKLKLFSPAQHERAAAIAGTVIPKTHTPGAIKTGVAGWLELLVQDCRNAAAQQNILNGLATVVRQAAGQFQEPYAKLTARAADHAVSEMKKGNF